MAPSMDNLVRDVTLIIHFIFGLPLAVHPRVVLSMISFFGLG